MAFCNQCGSKVEDGSRFCTSCGAPVDRVGSAGGASSQNRQTRGRKPGLEKYISYIDTTAKFKKEDTETNCEVSILAYLHILVLVPWLAAKESPFAQYHAKVGLNLLILHLIAEIGGSVLESLLGWVPVVGWIVGIVFGLLNAVLWGINIFGIISAAQGKARELTVLSSLKFIK